MARTALREEAEPRCASGRNRRGLRGTQPPQLRAGWAAGRRTDQDPQIAVSAAPGPPAQPPERYLPRTPLSYAGNARGAVVLSDS